MNSGRAGRAWLAVALLIGCHGDSGTGPTPPKVPAAVTIVAGDLQRGEVGVELPNPLVARVVDASGHAIPGAVVNFRVVAGGGTVFAGAGQTNADGIVQDRWTLGTSSADTQRVEVRAVDATTGQPLVFATFRAVGLPGPPSVLTSLSPDTQSAPAGGTLSDSLRVRVLDRYGNGVPRATVHFTPRPNAGHVSPDSVASDSLGRAATRFILGLRVAVTDSVAVSVAGITPRWFLVSALLPSDARVTLEGDGQVGTVAEQLANPLSVLVTTAAGEPVAGVPVSWAATAGQLVDPGAVSGADGKATAGFILGTTATTHVVTARVDTQSFRFTEFSRAGAPAAIRVALPWWTIQSAAGEPVKDSIYVDVVDRYGNGTPLTPVTFTPSDQGSVSPSGVQTNPGGRITAQWTLGTRIDSLQRLTIGSPGLQSVDVLAQARVPASARVLKIAGDSQSAVVGTTFPDSLVARVLLADGRALRGASVAWASNAGDAPSPAVSNTDPDGFARTALVAGARSGPAVITATVGGVATPASFTEHKLAAAPSSIAPSDGNDQVGAAGATLRDSARARVSDSNGNGVGGAMVTWQVAAGNGSVSSATSVTDTNGVAAVSWTLGDMLENRLTASVGGGVSTSLVASAITQVASISVGTYHSCLLTVEGATICWGWEGGLTGVWSERFSTMVRLARGYRFRQIVAGMQYTCGLIDDGSAYCWGSNTYGQLGTGTGVESSREPVPVAGGLHFASLATGASNHMCAIVADGTGYCWGANGGGELGTGTTGPYVYTPVRIAGGLAWRELSVAGSYNETRTCGLTTDGVAYCWGYYSNSPPATAIPTQIATQDSTIRFTTISANGTHSCAAGPNGVAYCLGTNFLGELGRGTRSSAYDSVARPVASSQSFVAIAVAPDASCGLTSAGDAFCWGRLLYTATSTDSTTATRCASSNNYQVACVKSPQPVLGGLKFTSISSGWGSTMTCGIATDHRAYCWGGTLVQGTTSASTDTGERPKRVMNQP